MDQQRDMIPSLVEWQGSSHSLWRVPTPLTPLLGREQEVVTLSEMLSQSRGRLITLLGIGGVGKTRLALQVLMEVRQHFVDGVCFVSLADIRDPQLVMSTIAQALGLQESSTLSLPEQVQCWLQQKQLLLVLDNFEHVIKAAAQVETLLIACPRLVVVVTSRTALHLQGEQQFPISPLALPDLPVSAEVEKLAQIPSIALFLQCAQSILPTFQLTSANAQTIAEICFRLQGLPLAIELAARHIKLLPPHSLLARLSHRFEVLSHIGTTFPLRQQSLRNTTKWSYDLLNEAEQRLFRRLAVFAGSWTLDAAETVCDDDDAVQEGIEVLSTMAALLDKSLLLSSVREGSEPRFQILLTMRAYGLECLQESGEAEQIQRKHALYYLALAEEVENLYQLGDEPGRWIEHLKSEQDNIRAALQWFIEHQEIKLALRLRGALWQFCQKCGHVQEQALASSQRVAPAIRSWALNRTGELALRINYHIEQSPVAGIPQVRGELSESELRLSALGPLHITRGGQPVNATSWGYVRVKELLFYLLDAPARTKEQIGLALWPDADLTQLRNNLHEALYYLRRALGRSEWIVYEQRRYAFNRQLPYDYDVERFEQSLALAYLTQATAPEQAIVILERAIPLYQGDFLEDLVAGDWSRGRRDELRRSYQQALRLLGQLYIAQNQYVQAAETYHRLIVHDHYQEDAHRELMRCYLRLGEHGQALRHYQHLASWMHEELGTWPSAETRSLLKYLRRDEEDE